MVPGGVMFREDADNIVHVLQHCGLSAAPRCFSLAPPVRFKDHLYLHLLLLCSVCVYACLCTPTQLVFNLTHLATMRD